MSDSQPSYSVQCEVQAAAAHHRFMLLTALTFGLALAMIILLIGFRWAVGTPLASLQRAIQKIAETGDHTPIPLSDYAPCDQWRYGVSQDNQATD